MAASLMYFNTASLDGYIAGPDGRWNWGIPDAEVHAFINDLIRPARTHLYGRRVFQVMTAWETFDLKALPPAERDWAEYWRSTDKIVYSSTLRETATARTALRSSFDAAEVRRMKETSDTPLTVGGGQLASVAARAGLLDEVHVVVAPAVVGGGTRYLADGVHLDLELRQERRFGNGSVYLGYAVRHSGD